MFHDYRKAGSAMVVYCPYIGTSTSSLRGCPSTSDCFSTQLWQLNSIFRRWSANKPHFTKAEAEALVGKRVLTLAAWGRVPQGTTGRVISTAPASAVKSKQGTLVAMYDVVIQWELPPRPSVSIGQAGEPHGLPHAGQSLMDWVTKDENVEFLTEPPSPTLMRSNETLKVGRCDQTSQERFSGLRRASLCERYVPAWALIRAFLSVSSRLSWSSDA